MNLPINTQDQRIVDLGHGCSLLYVRNFIAADLAAKLFERLNTQVAWEHSLTRFKTRELRGTSWQGTFPYFYSKILRPERPFDPVVLEIKTAVDRFVFGGSGEEYEGSLVTHYPNGKAGVGFHADDEPEIKVGPIASLSLGAGPGRQFSFVVKADKSPAPGIFLEGGSLCVMSAHTQRFFQHSLPRSSTLEPCINLTFRQDSGLRWPHF